MTPSAREQDHVAPHPVARQVGEVPPLDCAYRRRPLQRARRVGFEQEGRDHGRPRNRSRNQSAPAPALPVKMLGRQRASVATPRACGQAKPKKSTPSGPAPASPRARSFAVLVWARRVVAGRRSSRSSSSCSSRRRSAASFAASRHAPCACRSRSKGSCSPIRSSAAMTLLSTHTVYRGLLWSVALARAHAGVRPRVLRLDLPVRHAPPLLRLDLPVPLRARATSASRPTRRTAASA